jgi:hypothetical protein
MNPTTTPSSAAGPAPNGKPPAPWPDPDFERNRARVPLSELQRWADRHVAWSWDGTRIIAGAETLAALIAELHRTGVDPSAVVFDYIDAPDAAYI